jgi:hypothetical protein
VTGSDQPRPLSENDTLNSDEFFRDGAGEEWREIMRRLHVFARATGCPPGFDVIKWFARTTEGFHYFVAAKARVIAAQSSQPKDQDQ